jgi:hypothetical protein
VHADDERTPLDPQPAVEQFPGRGFTPRRLTVVEVGLMLCPGGLRVVASGQN